MTTSPEDRPTWLRLYLEEYWTLEQVGKLLGITREAVRLRLKAMGIKSRSSRETALLRERREISLRGDEIRDTFLQTRDVVETAWLTGRSEALVRRALGELVPDFEVLTRVPRDPSKKYSVDDLMDALREAAAAMPGILTTSGYDTFVATHPTLPDGRPRPGKQAVMLRFGFWRDALLRAGLPANPHSGPEKEFNEADAVAAVVECWRQTGGPPTSDGYDRWQRGHEGRPSMATVRNRAGNWNPLLVRAWQLVHGVMLDQDDEDVSVPEPLLTNNGTQPGATPFVPYCVANEGAEVSLRSDLVAAEYNALERAVRSHALIQNAVAAAAAAAGLEPWSPSAGAPTFDIAVSADDGRVFLVEVKSATPENLELQLRIGLGQVLRYAHQLRSHAQVVIPAIAIELRPDQSWEELLTELGVGLLVNDSIPGDLARLTIAHSALLGASRQVATIGQASSASKADEYLATGAHLFDQGRYADAEAAIREAIRLNPGSADAHSDLGKALRYMEQYPEAEAAYREAIRLDPDMLPAYWGLGIVFHDAGQYAEAEAAYRRVIGLTPEHSSAHCFLGNVLHATARTTEAENALKEAIRLNPENAFAHENLGGVLRDTQRFPESEAAYREAIRLNPDKASTYCDLGDIIRYMERFPEAEAAYREAIRLDPDYSYAHAGLGEVLGGTERHQEAVLAYREASRLNPDFALDLTISEEWLEYISTTSTQPHPGSAPSQRADAELPE
jgi:tetratricopeptide (TPR) repeat protein